MLHGKIEVNNIEIANWQAVNTQTEWDGLTIYKCRVAGRDRKGYPYEHSFNVLHEPNDGPLVLTWGIMQKASTLTRG